MIKTQTRVIKYRTSHKNITVQSEFEGNEEGGFSEQNINLKKLDLVSMIKSTWF